MAAPLKHAQHSAQIVPFPRRHRSLDDRLWKQMTTLGNRAFTEHRWAEAETCYRQALAEAEHLFDAACAGHGKEGCDAAPMLVVSAANIAENWILHGQDQQARDVMLALSQRLCAVIANNDGPMPFRRQCLTHLGPACLELISILPRAGMSNEAVSDAVAQAKAVALHITDTLSTKH